MIVMKELKAFNSRNWDVWFWLDKKTFEDEPKTGQYVYSSKKAVGQDTDGRTVLMHWVNHDRHDWRKFTQTFYEIDFDEYIALLDRAISQGEVKQRDRQHYTDKANAPFIPPWDIHKDITVYRDERYTLGQKDEKPYLIADGKTYMFTCHPYEPCLYITDEDGAVTAVHNAFEPFSVLDSFYRGDKITSITGFEYDAKDFCKMTEYAAGKVDIGIDEAEKIFGNRPKESNSIQPKEISEKSSKNETQDDSFHELLKEYPDSVIDYCIVKDDMPFSGQLSHRRALALACGRLFTDDGDGSIIWNYDVGKAEAKQIDSAELFYKGDKNGKLNYRNAFLNPPYGNDYTEADFEKINNTLFPNGTDGIEVYEWTTDWSDYFDDGHEWWGALCFTVYDKSLDRFVVIMASATD